MKLRLITIVPIAPTKRINPFVLSFVIDDPMIAAWAAPNPGRNPDNEDEINELDNALVISFLLMSVWVIFCWGRMTLSLRLINNMLMPNNPDNSGSKGCSKLGIDKTIMPRTPAIKKEINDQILE